MPTTARSSTRVNAAAGWQGVKGLRLEEVKNETRRFWMLNFFPRSRDALTRGCWIGKRREFCFEENVAGLAGAGIRKITISVCTLKIYNVNTSLQSKY